MNLYNNKLYLEDISYVENLNLQWDKIQNKSFLISGANGLIGSFLIDVLLQKNCEIYAVVRNIEKSKDRFGNYFDKIKFIQHDINEPLRFNFLNKIDYVIHLASNTHPIAYSTDPIGTITTNIIGTKNLLDFTVENNVKRFLFASSNEIYGENRGDVELFDEKYCGYIDSNTLRAGYPESKRCGEALCQAYISQKNIDVVIARFTRSYGPTILKSDTKAISQFIQKAISGEDIVLKSDGNQFYSYTYVADAVAGLLTILISGMKGEAYNISDEKSDIKLKDLANLIAIYCNKKVIFERPNLIELKGYSKATKARLCNDKLTKIGWRANYTIKDGIERTIDILRDLI